MKTLHSVSRSCRFMHSAIFVILMTGSLWGQYPRDLAAATVDFLNSLSPEEIQKVKYDFDDTLRLKWSNLPVGMVSRAGIQYGSLPDESRIAFHQVLSAMLSSQGYLKITSIMQLDDILNTLVREAYDKGQIDQERLTRMQDLQWAHENFFISVWGEPGVQPVWGLNFGGHHLALNLTVAENSISVSPLFLGADPAEIKSGKYSGWRVLSKEEDYGFLLLNSLTGDQKGKAVLSQEVPRDILTNPNSSQRITEYYGIQAKEFTREQQAVLELLIQEYTHNFDHTIAHNLYDKIIKTGIDQVYFAWIGSQERNKPHYYLIHGPDFLIEYDNYPNNGNHIHLIMRENGNDFGEDLLQAHYLNSEHHKKE